MLSEICSKCLNPIYPIKKDLFPIYVSLSTDVEKPDFDFYVCAECWEIMDSAIAEWLKRKDLRSKVEKRLKEMKDAKD